MSPTAPRHQYPPVRTSTPSQEKSCDTSKAANPTGTPGRPPPIPFLHKEQVGPSAGIIPAGPCGHKAHPAASREVAPGWPWLLTQEGAGDVLGHLVPGAAGLRQVRQLPVQHPLELWVVGGVSGVGDTPGGSGVPMPAGVTVTVSLTLLEAISLTECLVCSVSSWSKHQSSSSRVSRESFWWASSAGDTLQLGTGPASGAATGHGGTGATPNPGVRQRWRSQHPPRGTEGDAGGRGGRARASPGSGAEPRGAVAVTRGVSRCPVG